MDKTYNLIGGATITVTVAPQASGAGYRVSAKLDTSAADGTTHDHGANGGTVIDNMDRGNWHTENGNWWRWMYRGTVAAPSAAIARRMAEAWIKDAGERVGAAIAARESKLRMMAHILP
jgi:hypothetical protein